MLSAKSQTEVISVDEILRLPTAKSTRRLIHGLSQRYPPLCRLFLAFAYLSAIFAGKKKKGIVCYAKNEMFLLP